MFMVLSASLLAECWIFETILLHVRIIQGVISALLGFVAEIVVNFV